METINIMRSDNGGYTIFREAVGGLVGFTIWVSAWEEAQEMVIKILEHEYRVAER